MHSHSHQLAYRPDIDGLRAVAVLSVIGFHAASGLFPGGYVGVDIFFVISGYLITSIICRQLAEGRFSFAEFYARRCKRIFPALLIVLAAVLACGWVFLLPDEFERVGKHIAAGAGFVSNLALWRESGYFDKAAETKPLLHLWSLGIEEQFYLLWPPLLVLAWKRKWDVLKIVGTIVSVSFAVNVMLVSLWQSSDTYYLPPTRFWELLLGAALAYAHLFRKQELDRFLKPVSPNVRAAMGLILIVAAVFALNKATFFPGWWGLLPTIGAALLISAGPFAWINSWLLASRLLVFVGLISYPLYLWHWPLISYAQIIEAGAPSRALQFGAVALAFLLAWLTYRLVEKPIRSASSRAAWALVSSLVVVGCLGLAVFSHTMRARSDKFGVGKILSAANEWEYPGHNLKSFHSEAGYHFEQGSGSAKVLFVGDSNMEQYYPRIDKLLSENPNTTRGVLFVTRAGCLPIPYMKGFAQRKCEGVAETALSLAQRDDVDTVVIGAGWPGYSVFDSGEGEHAYYLLADTIERYKRTGRRVYLILPVPIMAAFDPYHLVTRSLLDFGFKIDTRTVERARVDAALNTFNARLVKIAEAAGADTLDPVRHICGAGDCPTFTNDGFPVYKDAGHLRPGYVREHVTFLDALVLASDRE